MVTDYHQALNRLLIALLLCWSTDALAQVNWPNEPAGVIILSDHNFTTCEANGWTGNCGTIASDATAPLSPTSVMRWTYNPSTGLGGGEINLPLNVNEVYIGYWVKLGTPFEGEPNGSNKFTFGFDGNNGNGYWTKAHGATGGGPFFIQFHMQGSDPTIDNCHVPGGFGECFNRAWDGPTAISLGVWHRVELYYRHATAVGNNDGVARVWLDGNLELDLSELDTPPGPIVDLFFSPTWAGPSGRTNADQISFDHVRVSVPNCGAQGCPEPTPAWPNEPTGTTELLDFAFNVTQGSGLDDVNETGVIVSDSTAPLSPVNVFRSRLQNGIAPGGVELRYDLPDLTEMFAGVWWKPNTTFQGLQSGFNRLMGFAQNESNAYLAWVGAQNLSGLSGSIQFYMPLGATAMNNCHLTGWQGNCPGEGRLLPNMSTCTINATDDEWHRIELYVRRSASAIDRTGIVRWWVDGNLCGNYDPQAGTGVNWGPSGFDYWFWTESWATVPAGQSADWIHYLDHLYLSRPQGATSVDVMPPGPVSNFSVTTGGPPPPDPPPVGVSPGAEWFQFF